MTFNEFQRELQRKNVDARTAYFLTLLFERQTDVVQQMDEMAKAILLFAEQLQGFVNLRELDAKDIEAVKRRVGMIGKVPGIEVHSVRNEPE